MIDLHDRDSGALIAKLEEHDLAVLVRVLEEEHSSDQDYYLDAGTLHLLAAGGMRRELLLTLGQALGEREGMDVVWTRRQD